MWRKNVWVSDMGQSGYGEEMLTSQVDRVVVDKRVTLSLVEPGEREHTL